MSDYPKDALENQLTYWQKQLVGAPTLLELPTDHPRPAQQSFRRAFQSFVLPPALSQALQTLSQQEGTSLFMTLLAAFQVVLYRYSGQEDIVVGTPVGEGSVEVIGGFVNTLALRTQLRGEMTFHELLMHVREVVLGAYAHQALPFDRLVEALQVERSLSYNPLFQVMFDFQSPHAESFQLFDFAAHQLEADRKTASFDLTLEVRETVDGLQGRVEYGTDLFDGATIERMMRHWQVLLEAAVAHPNQAIGTLPLLTEQEKTQILVEWNASQLEYPKDRCIHQLFEAQVERTPKATAVIFEGVRLTYRELNARANQLARYLRGSGIGPDVLVGIYMERSIEMIVSLLGILKAGGAYVPLDPGYPTERVAFMWEDAAAPVLLSQARLVSSLSMYEGNVLCLDTEWAPIAQEETGDLHISVRPENLAYVIYTSGSTGKPKGVAMRHAALANLILWQIEASKLGTDDKTLQFTSLSFDVSFQEIFTSWCSGGNLVLVSEELRKDMGALLQFIKEAEIRRLFLPFVALQQFAQIADVLKIVPNSLCEIITAGEQLQITLPIINLLSHIPGCKLYNQYGPTEGHVVTAFSLEGSPEIWPSLPSIGRPVANTQIYLLDGYRQPVPIGVAGELYIGGVQLACGYLNRSDLTAEKFIEHTFEEGRTERLYRTGDLARYLPDGNIEYLGRIDYQVKVRGFRIELGEIETVLRQHPDVREVAVLAREDVPGEKRLVAYLVVKQGQRVTGGEWRAFVKERLPEYMVPTVFQELEAFPLTPSGKLDRRALPAPERTRREGEESFVPPRTETERQLAQIWTAVLGINQVGVCDNFFELGGHSLLATKIVSRVREKFQVELPLRAVFECPTLAELGDALKHLQTTQRSTSPQKFCQPFPKRTGGTNLFPLSPMQQGMWFLNQLEPESPFYNISFALRLTGKLQVELIQQALQEMMKRHEVLRTTFVKQEEHPKQLVAPLLHLELPLIEIQDGTRAEQEHQVTQLAQLKAQQPFDLTRGPLVRTMLLHLSEDEHVLLFIVHHLVFDGWSMDVFLKELAAIYTAFASGQASLLPPLSIQYADYAAWQHQQLQGEGLEEELSYWRQQLAGAPPLLELPTDHPRPAMPTFQGSHSHFQLPSGLLRSLQTLSQQEGTTLFMTLLAAFQVVLYRYSGQEDIVVGTPVAGRLRKESEELIGCFVNTLALRTQLGGEMTFRELLSHVREVALRAYAHQEVPFDRLVEALHLERNLRYNPLFQVMFTLENISDVPVRFGELSASLQEYLAKISQFDLTLELKETTEELQGFVEYSTDLFEEATIERMIGHWQIIMEAVVINPEQQLAKLPLLTEQEKQQIVVEWNATYGEYPDHRSIHQLFEEQVARTPEAVAVVFGDMKLTYQELNEQANRLAQYLQRVGVRPGMLVGIYMERSLEMVVGLLGTLKAGGAYVPLDPGYPAERIAFMLEDAQIAVLLTQQRYCTRLPGHITQMVCLDQSYWLDSVHSTI